jgi:hypothetical protein
MGKVEQRNGFECHTPPLEPFSCSRKFSCDLSEIFCSLDVTEEDKGYRSGFRTGFCQSYCQRVPFRIQDRFLSIVLSKGTVQDSGQISVNPIILELTNQWHELLGAECYWRRCLLLGCSRIPQYFTVPESLLTYSRDHTNGPYSELDKSSPYHCTIWRMTSSGMLSRVALGSTDVSEELSAYFIRVTRIG